MPCSLGQLDSTKFQNFVSMQLIWTIAMGRIKKQILVLDFLDWDIEAYGSCNKFLSQFWSVFFHQHCQTSYTGIHKLVSSREMGTRSVRGLEITRAVESSENIYFRKML